jgi:hypothetical protein
MMGIPGMAVPVFAVVNAGLAMTFLGGGLLLLIALWWARAGDGIEIPVSAGLRRPLRRDGGVGPLGGRADRPDRRFLRSGWRGALVTVGAPCFTGGRDAGSGGSTLTVSPGRR